MNVRDCNKIAIIKVEGFEFEIICSQKIIRITFKKEKEN
jgi:hypothetical protein